jgi:acyl-CoA synthetase (AMP-forming)/AMP-acid ligase II
MDVTSLLRRAVAHNGARECAVHYAPGGSPAGTRRLSFNQAWERACRWANALLALGLQPGDRFGVLEDNCLESVDVFAGAAIANLVRVPMYPRNRREAHAFMLAHTGCRAVVVAEHYAHELAGITDDVPTLDHVLVRDGGYEAWLSSFPATDPAIPVAPDDWYVIRHTGGTTGLPKGVGYTHRAWLAAGRDWFYLFPPVEPGDRCLHVAPISHGSGYLFVPVWLQGGSNVVVSKFDAGEVLDILDAESIAYTFLVPTMINAICRHPAAAGGRALPQLKCLQTGAAPIADETALLARQLFGDRLWQGYGQTEAVPVTMMGPRQWFATVEGSEPLRSCGLPLPFADVEIRDVDDPRRVLPVGEEGELVIRCDGQMSGFWDDPEATAARMVDGWVMTGDIGRIDANGYVYVVDRKDDMIVSGGFNIYPAELENVITDHPAVVECAVFAVPDERWGETPCAVCTVDGVTEVSEQEIVDLVSDRLGSYKRPGKVVLTTEPLPKSVVGKILRKALREPHWAGVARRVAGS